MRPRIALAIAFGLLVVGVAPAAAAPDKSPKFVELPIVIDTEFPNPCLGEDVIEPYHFEGRFLIHEFTNPSGNYHFNNVGYLSALTDSGFSMPEKMIGVDVENISGNTYTYTGTGLYQLRNDDGQKLRFQIKIQTTVVGDETRVDMFGLEFACLGNSA